MIPDFLLPEGYSKSCNWAGCSYKNADGAYVIWPEVLLSAAMMLGAIAVGWLAARCFRPTNRKAKEPVMARKIGKVARVTYSSDMCGLNKGRIEFYLDNSEEWRWRVIARNGRITAVSSEGYKTLTSAKVGACSAENTLANVQWDGGVAEDGI